MGADPLSERDVEAPPTRSAATHADEAAQDRGEFGAQGVTPAGAPAGFEEAFDAFYSAKTELQIRWGLGLSALLCMGFAPLDYVQFPDTWRTLWAIRFSMSALLLAVTFVHRRGWSPRQSQALLGLATFVACMGLLAMITVAPGTHAALYVTGIALVFAYGVVIICLRYKAIMLTGLAVLVGHEALVVPFGHLGDVYLNNNRAAILGTCVFMGFGAYLAELQLRRNFKLESLLRRRLLELNAANEAVARASEERKRFHAFVNHELRNPITAIACATDLLQGQVTETSRARLLEILASSSGVVQRILEDVLDLSRLEDGRIAFEALPLDPAALAREVSGPQQTLAEKNGIELTLRSEGGHRVHGDSLRIGQALRNLVSNAVKFTERGQVSVVTTTEALADGRVEVCFAVTDTGIGIAPDRIERLFERFQQADETISRRFGGTGLGLSICKQLCEQMGGELEVSSQPNIGSTFKLRFCLPEASPEASTEDVAWRQAR